MQEHSLLATKLYIPPVRPELVSRPRLIERLNAGLPTRGVFPRALTLISAPAGFGKTTLLSEWVRSTAERVAAAQHAAPLPVAWLSLDEGDNDPARFLAYLIAALRTIEPRQEYAGSIGKGVLSALQSPGVADTTKSPVDEAVLTSLINEITTLSTQIILVLDDYHLIDAQEIHDALTFLLRHLPPQMHLVIASREDPHLPLARLRARGKLIELRASDLRFTTSEAAQFLNQAMGLALSAEDISALERRTEGWIAGLQLAALALQGEISVQGRKDTPSLIESFTGSHRFVLDYLIEEVLEQQSESVQAFLLQTAILDRMCGPLCDAVCFGSAETPGSSSGTAVLQGKAETADPSERVASSSGTAVLQGKAESADPSERAASSSGTAVLQGKAESADRSARAATAEGVAESGQATLEALDRANLFLVALDEERCWYRYHRLFADLLRRRLRQTQPERIPTLHHRASEWYEKNGFIDEAIEHALRAEGFQRAADLIEESVDTIWQRGEHAKLRRWLAGLPVELVSCKPHLCIFQAWGLFVSGHHDAAERSLQAAEQALGPCRERATKAPPQEQNQQSDSDVKKIQGRVAALRAYMATYHGDTPRMHQYARQALESLPEQELSWRIIASIALADAHLYQGEYTSAYRARLGALEASNETSNIYLIITSSLRLAIVLREQGALQRVIDICQQQLQLVEESGLSQSGSVGWLLAIWGEVLAEMNHLDEALEKTRKGLELAERGGDVAILGLTNLCLVRVLFSRGDFAGAAKIMQKMENRARQYAMPPWMTSEMAAWQAWIWLAQDKLSAACQWVEERGLEADREPTYLNAFEYRVLARIRIAQGQVEHATMLLQRLLEAAEAGQHTSRVIEILMLQALAFQAGGGPTQAVTRLERALTLAEPEGFVRIFVDEGPPMVRLLHEAVSRGIAPDYARRLLAAFPASEADQLDRWETQAPGHDLVEPLSERELEVLELVARGLTNREIASRLFLSLNTVKAHTRNIYGKLGVRSRTQAVAKARSLGVLSSI